MRIKCSFWSLAVAVLALASLPALFAEVADIAGTPDTPTAPSPMGRGFGFHSPTTGQPYSATRTVTHVQTLANGTTITHTSVFKESRDSSGRTYTESTVEGKSFTTYRVFDPVNRISISWNSNSKDAYVTHLPDPSQFHQNGQPQGDFQRSNSQGAGGFRGNFVKPTVENLGIKSIDSVTAEGTRSTRTIPAGKDGNSQPLVTTHETWFNSDLKLEISRTDNDPRTGNTTVHLSNIQRNEPDATLFSVPEGYTVHDQAGRRPRPQFGMAGGPH
jgi:hypothetical protein